MSGYDKLKALSYAAAQGTSFMKDFTLEVQERIKDLQYVYPKGETLLIGATPSEIKAWQQVFGERPTAISLQEFIGIEVMDMHEMSFVDNGFDYIYASNVLEHSPAPIIALMEIHRVLKPEGQAFFWMPEDIENQLEEYHYSCFPKAIWVSLIEKAGFIVTDTYQSNNQVGYLCSN